MNHFECAFAHLAYIKTVNYKKCWYRYVDRNHVDYVITYNDGFEDVVTNASLRSHANRLMNMYISSKEM